MKTPRIDGLDLRPWYVISALEAEAFAAAKSAKDKRKWDEVWDFPAFPARTAKCIETGKFALWGGKAVTFTIKMDMSKFITVMDEAVEAMKNYDTYIIDHLGTLSWRFKYSPVAGSPFVWEYVGSEKKRQWVTQDSVWPGNLLAIGLILGSIAFIAWLACR